MADVKAGQTWRSEDGYLYRIVHVEGKWAWGKHPNQRRAGSMQILLAWFDEPGWELVRDAA